MQLYIDDVLKDDAADAEALGRALMLFKPLGHKRLTLRRDPCRQLTLSRWDDEVFIEVQTPGRVEGVLALAAAEGRRGPGEPDRRRAGRRLPALPGGEGKASLSAGADAVQRCRGCRTLTSESS